MKIINFLLVLLFSMTTALASEVIELGISTSLESNVLKESRPYLVYLPPSYHSSENVYPVIYLLDGDVNRFKGFVGVLESLSTATLESQVQQAIVIGIPNTDRARDLTPTELKQWTFKEQVLDSFDKSGGASQFCLFLKNELIPKIESSYRTSKKRVLIGESFGGLFSANTLLHFPTLFTDYLIIDPTAVWDNDYLNKTYEHKFQGTKFNRNVFFAFANNSRLGEIGLTNYKWGTKFASAIIKNVKGQAFARQQYFENERHGTVAFLAWYNGLRALMPTPRG